LPFAVLYVISLLDTKIKSRNDILNSTTIPFIGDIPNNKTNEKVVSINSRTNTAEAIRIVRTNIEFLLTNNIEGQAKTIFLTSTFPKEGKTFVSVNLASTIALSGKKVLLIGMDIRNPKFDDYISVPNVGVTNFIASKEEVNIDNLIVKIENFDSLYVLPAGVIPPNPAELLMDNKVDMLFADLKKKFDYIIVDTAPVSLVTDTLIIAKNADAFVYVARANFLDKRMLELPQKLYVENKLPNMSILLNDTNCKKQYGYGYGYGYGEETVSRKYWKSFFKK
jgi:capsular exopolysaccharide synthesis family protein